MTIKKIILIFLLLFLIGILECVLLGWNPLEQVNHRSQSVKDETDVEVSNPDQVHDPTVLTTDSMVQNPSDETPSGPKQKKRPVNKKNRKKSIKNKKSKKKKSNRNNKKKNKPIKKKTNNNRSNRRNLKAQNQPKNSNQQNQKNHKSPQSVQPRNKMFGDKRLPLDLTPSIRSKYASDNVRIDPPQNEIYPAIFTCKTSPPTQDRRKCSWLVLIMNMFSHKEARDAVRDTWVSSLSLLDGVCYRFVVGQPEPSVSQEMLETVASEDNIHGDIMWLNHTEDYYSLTEKTFHALAKVYQEWDVDFVFKTDEDSYVRIDEVREWIAQDAVEDPQETCMYAGHIRWNSGPIRKPKHKAYIPEKFWPFKKYPAFPPGAGYILSQNCIQALIGACNTSGLKYIRLEDVSVGINIDPLPNVKRYSSGRFTNKPDCEPPTLLCHHLSPKKMRQFHSRYNN